MAVSVSIRDLVKHFGPVKAIDRVSLEIEPGEIFFLLGPSGCGKTTLLRTIAGFNISPAGTIFIGGEDVSQLPPHKRGTGMVFQSYALWPHMTVRENVAFGLDLRKVPRDCAAKRVEKALDTVHMLDRADYRPNQLSGGQQQRVALARALVIEPRCLLLDEPLSNLDAKLRIEMRREIRNICKGAGLTAIYVTHDQKEALAIADRIAVLNGGKVEQTGSPVEVYRNPKNRFVAGFIGETNFLDASVCGVSGERIVLDCALGRICALCPPSGGRNFGPGDKATLSIRPESLKPGRSGGENVFCLKACESSYQGETTSHVLRTLPASAWRETALLAVELGPGALSAQNGLVHVHIPPGEVGVL